MKLSYLSLLAPCALMFACSSTPDAETPAAPGGHAYSMPVPPGPTGAPAAMPITPMAMPMLQPLVVNAGSSDTAGMAPFGSPFGGTFLQGQVVEQDITLEPGRCYAVSGAGLGISELDIEIWVQPGATAPPYVAGRDQTVGGQALLGGTANCFVSPFTMAAPAKVVLKATGGNGMALAQVLVQ